MKQLVLWLALLGSSLVNRPNHYQVNSKDSTLTWTGYSEVGSYALTGTITLQKGSFDYDGKVISGGTFILDMRSIRHQEDRLQTHLRGADFFDVERYPEARFVLQQVEKGIAKGQLTVKGITKPLSFPVTIGQTSTQLRIQGKAQIDRTQYGIYFNSSNFFQNLGNQAIKNNFDLTFDLQASVE